MCMCVLDGLAGLHSVDKRIHQQTKPPPPFHGTVTVDVNGLQIGTCEVLHEELHEVHIVLQPFQTLPGVEREISCVSNNGSQGFVPGCKACELPNDAVVWVNGRKSHHVLLGEMEHTLQLLNGRDGEGFLSCLSLVDGGNSGLQCLVCSCFIREMRVEEIPDFRHFIKLRERERGRVREGEREIST